MKLLFEQTLSAQLVCGQLMPNTSVPMRKALVAYASEMQNWPQELGWKHNNFGTTGSEMMGVGSGGVFQSRQLNE